MVKKSKRETHSPEKNEGVKKEGFEDEEDVNF